MDAVTYWLEESSPIQDILQTPKQERNTHISQLLDNILSRSNMLDAYNQVRTNKGSAGIDGVTIDEIDDYLRKHWRSTKELIKQRKYKPQPVLRVEIPNLTAESVS